MSNFLLLLLLLPILSLSKPCPPCGTTPVPFPLSTSPSCGDQSYKIRCSSSSAANSSTLLFDALGNSSYSITSISSLSQRLVIAPAPFLPNTCVTADLHSQGIALNSSLPFNVSSDNTIFLLNCTQRLLLSPLNCSSNSLCHLYVNATPALSAPCNAVPLCCTFRAGGSSTSYAVRASGVGCSAYRSFVDLDPNAGVATWGTKQGVELQWASPREPLCRSQGDCEDGPVNATCRPDAVSGGGIRRCFCNQPLTWDPITGICAENVPACEVDGSCGSSNKAPLIAGLVSGICAAILVGTAGFFLYTRQRRIRIARERTAKEREDILNLNNSTGRSAKYFTGREIKRATTNFARDNLLGIGGYGEVYKGNLDDGTLVAVKCAKLGNTKSTDQVLNEVRILLQVNHRSLVRLLGCCVDLDQPLMVYEFIPNGTLFDHLHGSLRSPFLTWRRRLAIAHQTAEGLAYLHSSAEPPIYHRDVKSSNILLDDKLNAKVSDFGLSRLAEPGLSHVSTCAQGTLGYLDPEYYRNYQLTDKSDVYSYGVVLLELLTSKKAIDFNRGPDDVNLAVYVQRRVDEERLMDVVDAGLMEGASQVELDTIKAIGFLAMGCLEEKRQNRPGMKEVVEEIEYVMSIEVGAAENQSKSK